MTASTVRRFREFANAQAPLAFIDQTSGLTGADLHAIAEAIDETKINTLNIVIVPELDLRGGATNLRPLLPMG